MKIKAQYGGQEVLRKVKSIKKWLSNPSLIRKDGFMETPYLRKSKAMQDVPLYPKQPLHRGTGLQRSSIPFNARYTTIAPHCSGFLDYRDCETKP